LLLVVGCNIVLLYRWHLYLKQVVKYSIMKRMIRLVLVLIKIVVSMWTNYSK